MLKYTVILVPGFPVQNVLESYTVVSKYLSRKTVEGFQQNGLNGTKTSGRDRLVTVGRKCWN